MNAYKPVVREGMSTPWGMADSAYVFAEGIGFVGTPRHGGLKLNRSMNAKVPEYMRRPGGWYEEDCEFALAALAVFDEFWPGYVAAWRVTKTKEEVKESLKSTFASYYPDEYERFYGVTLKPGESHEKDKRRFAELNAENWVVDAAWGDWHENVPTGMVGVVTSKGGSRKGERRYFLVPANEYKERGPFGVVIDGHVTWEGPEGRPVSKAV